MNLINLFKEDNPSSQPGIFSTCINIMMIGTALVNLCFSVLTNLLNILNWLMSLQNLTNKYNSETIANLKATSVGGKIKILGFSKSIPYQLSDRKQFAIHFDNL